MPFYECYACSWITESGTRCARCLSTRRRTLTISQYEHLINIGRLTYCSTCEDFHPGAVKQEKLLS